MKTPDYLDYHGVAEMTDITVGTLRKYLSRSRAGTGPYFPEPDRMFGQSPTWKPRTILRWMESRPGRGVGGTEARERYKRERGE